MIKKNSEPNSLHQNVNLPIGIFLTMVAWTFFAVLNACIKAIAQEIPTHAILFFENFFALLLFIPFISIEPKILKTKKLSLIILRSIFGILTYYFLFFSVKLIPLVDAALLSNTAPLFIPFILYFWIKKKIPLKQLLGIFLGFIGVIYILQPGIEIISVGSLLALASGIFAAGSMTSSRLLSSESPITVCIYYLFISSVVLFPMLWLDWQMPSSRVWLLLISAGILMYFLQVFYTQAYKYACATDLGPFSYIFVIVSGLIDWLIWNDVPTLSSLVGIILVIIGGILTILFSETKIKRMGKRQSLN